VGREGETKQAAEKGSPAKGGPRHKGCEPKAA